MTDLKTLLKAQAALQKQLTHAYSNFKKTPKDRLSYNYIKTKLELFEKSFKVFQDNHLKILHSEDFQDDEYFVQYFEIEEVYTDAKERMLLKLNEFKVPSEPSESSKIQNIKLPPIQIPVFDGQYSEWISFHDQFSSLVHSNDSLSNVVKLHLLKQNLVGEAANLLKNIAVTENNYDHAWGKLKKRYSNKRIIVNAYLSKLMSLRNITNENVFAIKNLLDTTTDCLSGLQGIGVDIETWDPIIIYLLTSKLDNESVRHWEEIVNKDLNEELPTYKQLSDFLEMRFRSLEGAQSTKRAVPNTIKKVFYATSKEGCVLCNGGHYIYKCKQFAEMMVPDRKKFVEQKRLCFNCLIPNHAVKTCRQSSKCRICGKRHHSLLHTEIVRTPPERNEQQEYNQHRESRIGQTQLDTRESEVTNSHHTTEFFPTTNILLATAIVKAESPDGQTTLLRALIDQGSEGSFITKHAAQILGLRQKTISGKISGLGSQIVAETRSSVNFILRSNNDENLHLPVNAYVLSSLTRLLPSRQVNNTWSHLHGITLADPEFYKPAKIDLLLGAEVYCKIILDGIITGSAGSPLAQRTKLGWILSGEVNTTTNLSSHMISMHITTEREELKLLQKFWELETEDSYKHVRKMTDEELLCEEIYEKTHTRDETGRYIVEIPFKDNTINYGDTKQIAEKRLELLERRLNKDQRLKTEYTKVLNEYLDLNHMEEVHEKEEDTHNKFYMPHMAIIRPDKTTSRVRVVFDASCKGPNGMSLNDNMLVGPKLQQDLKQIVMRWRNYPIAFTADCVKMYRQIRVTQESANYQRILWKIDGHLKEFRLNRVTFGTASAPYLATKTLQTLAIDEEELYPKASLIIKTDFYMDDLLSGAHNMKEALEIYTEISKLMNAGGFELQKWTSNKEEFIQHIEDENTAHSDTYIIKSDEIIKTLGIKWNKNTDTFHYDINQPSFDKPVTKRLILSQISRLFDPIGWIAPVVISAKVIIQKLWLARIAWDEEVPSHIKSEWLKFCTNLKETENIVINRYLGTCYSNPDAELHGYCDASQIAYAAVVYVRLTKADGTIHTELITAKTRVAPIKTVSIPRLELCGAVLLVKLLKEVADTLKISHENIHAYTDSKIVLAWLLSHPSKWKTFVANRTSEILNTLPAIKWNHVESTNNPADVASRGATPIQLQQNLLWWSGPSDLLKKEITYRQLKDNYTSMEKRQTNIKTLTNIVVENNFNLLERYSSLTKLLRVTAYVLRFLNKTKYKETYLRGEEILKARDTCIRLCQREAFTEEIDRISKGQNVRKSSKIISLNPFIDDKQIVRVGGRLQNSNLPVDTKHQIILPERHPFTKLILKDIHIRTMHGGQMLMLSNLRKEYWVIHAKKQLKQIVHKCIVCSRHRATTKTQLMGSLPEQRVVISKTFSKSAVDFAGPIDLRMSKGRGIKTQKGYLAIFICLVTRAIHIEIVTSLYAQDFIAAFKRFVARRGHCSEMWSDNATNLTAGNKELKAMFKEVIQNVDHGVKNLLANDGTTWHHIPASAPHFGGLWEAGVKSVKFHLKRVLNNSTLTYEEMSTVTSQIEACLNSRPISSMSDDPSDLQPLTPGHFLYGEAPITVPDVDYLNSNISRLSRWQHVQKIMQDFWKRWSNEYLSRLQQRPKWMTKQHNLKLGDLVLLKDDNLPPSKWNLGRIVALHPGADNLVRVVSVKGKNSIVKRPITRICCLPMEQ